MVVGVNRRRWQIRDVVREDSVRDERLGIGEEVGETGVEDDGGAEPEQPADGEEVGETVVDGNLSWRDGGSEAGEGGGDCKRKSKQRREGQRRVYR